MARVEVYIYGSVAVFNVKAESFLDWLSSKFGKKIALLHGIAITYRGETMEFFK